MAQEKIIISFKAVGAPQLERAIRSLTKAQREYEGAVKGAVKQTSAFGATSPRMTEGANKGAKAFASWRNSLLLFNFALGMGIKQLYDFARQAAIAEGMGRAFNTLAGGGENASIAIDKLKEATDGTMSQFDLFQQANNAMILGVSRNSDEMAEMFDIAQRLGHALGRDTRSSVESLITGIGRQSRLMLDNIGIIVKAEEAYEAYAEKLDTTVDKLTDAEKKQAFLSATMVAARTKVAALGEEVESTQAKIERMGASYKDAANSLGDLVNTILNSSDTWGRLSEALNNTNTAISGNIDSNKELNDAMQFALGVIVNTNPHLQHLALGFGLNTQNLKLFKEEIQATSFSLGVLNDLYLESPWALPEIEPVGEMELKDFHPLSDANKNEIVIESLKQMTKWANEFNKTKLTPDYSEWEKQMQKQIDLAEGLADAIARSVLQANNFNSAIKAMGNVIIEEAKRIVAQEAASWLIKSVFSMFGGPFAGIGAGMQTLGIFHQGGLISEKKPVQRFATGGTVQGGDNVPILAQGGEFVMSRSAVESIGIENLNRMNQGGGGAINVSIQGNLLTEEYVETELAEKISTAVRRGVDFGIS